MLAPHNFAQKVKDFEEILLRVLQAVAFQAFALWLYWPNRDASAERFIKAHSYSNFDLVRLHSLLELSFVYRAIN